MNKYLEKIADNSEKGDGVGIRLAKDVIATGAVSVPAHYASQEIGQNFLKEIKKKNSGLDVGKISTIRKMKRDHKLDFDISPGKIVGRKGNPKVRQNLAYGEGPFYAHNGMGRERPFIHTAGAKNIGVLAHEVGHAASLKNSSTAYRVAHGVSSIATKFGVGGAIGTTMLMNDKTKDKAWMAPVIAAAPMVGEEINANRHAYNAFKKHEGRAVANKFLKKIVSRNMASYVLPVAGSAGALALANKMIKPHKNKEIK